MKLNIFQLLWESFSKVQGLPSTIFGLVLTIGLWVLKPDMIIPIQLWVLVASLIIFLIIMATLINAMLIGNKQKNQLPRVIHGRKNSRNNILCLMEPSELFSYNMLVAFYHIGEENFEQIIGLGAVINIQRDGKIQIEMTNPLDEHKEIISKIASNDALILQQTRIKPFVPFDAFIGR